ncbi:P-loop containing nucleoside triphosphate hydrolase protein [Phascolomyces articulosus]|uniref:Elongation factor 2 n=1 Tax=Phascolomyces articulosus TaxID=60185 RepID=A0AAD5K4A8_9FUNG|nr:P-loop containing nucleoside triphosphate hydrolase protein [Phascolomyces articulosus]
MDYLKAERERGITINSAAITFGWKGNRINLIDTPGHVDFTIEVERAVRVLDGAVTILDGVAGVEAQTETVWRQSERYGIPRIAFVNKLDRTGAAYGRTIKEIWKKLRARPLALQIPLMDPTGGKGIIGVADLVTMEMIEWDDLDGSTMQRTPLDESAELYQEAVRGRMALVETLAELDDGIVEVFFDEADGDHMLVSADALKESLRRVTLANKAVPVLCGAAFKNLGVQPVLDAVVDYLPSPAERPAALATIDGTKHALIPLEEDGKLCALAFKVTHDPRAGPLVYVKVYSGKINKRMTLYNTTMDCKERVNKLLQMYAREAEDIPSITAGNIGVIVGLKNTRTGDTLVQSNDTGAIKSNLQLGNIDIPSPAFFAAIEPASVSEEKAVDEALRNLTREDPSLKVWTDEDSGQTLISGMGELHLEIVKDRLINDFKCKAEVGKMRISYRETCQSETAVSASYDREVMGKRSKAKCQVELVPVDEEYRDDGSSIVDSGNYLQMDLGYSEDQKDQHHQHQTSSSSDSLQLSKEDVRRAVHTGLLSGLARGAILGFPLTKLKVKVHDLETFGQDTSIGSISACVAIGVQEAIKQASPCLLEPMMEVHTEVNESDIGSVVGDLSGTRRGHVIGLESSGSDDTNNSAYQQDVEVYAPRDSLLANSEVGEYKTKQVVKAHVPLSSMLGYSNALRSLTGGSGSFSMRVIGYGQMSKDRERGVVEDMRGY